MTCWVEMTSKKSPPTSLQEIFAPRFAHREHGDGHARKPLNAAGDVDFLFIAALRFLGLREVGVLDRAKLLPWRWHAESLLTWDNSPGGSNLL